MSMERTEAEIARENEATRDVWNANAGFWDEGMGEGNAFFNILIWPAVERLLAIEPSERVLDVACGNGLTPRRLAELGAEVLGTDFASGMIDLARERSAALPSEVADRIEYAILDATDAAAIRALGDDRFDAALCNMALFDMSDVRPLFRALPAVLKPGGRFVFSIVHPCFNHARTQHYHEREDSSDGFADRYGVKISGYLTPTTSRGLAMKGQFEPHLYFDRPLQDLLGQAFEAGWVLDALEEPAFPPDHQREDGVGWNGTLSEIPPVLVARMRGA
jgi:SAM-dependent methyltransferase